MTRATSATWISFGDACEHHWHALGTVDDGSVILIDGGRGLISAITAIGNSEVPEDERCTRCMELVIQRRFVELGLEEIEEATR